MSRIADITRAIVDALNGAPQPFDQAFTAVRSYRPQFDLEDMTALHVTVVPRTREGGTPSRGTAQDRIVIDVAVQKRLDEKIGDEEQIDALVGLTEQIADFLATAGPYAGARWIEDENAPVYSREHLTSLHQFTTVVSVSLLHMRERDHG
ncbi:MAG: hypothetical protein NT031_00105 [Planctomycetota bacterium]|nr:hypothetical protein [Planctomycetota bacterium]